MSDPTNLPPGAARRLARPLGLTRAGMVAERATRAFWPLWSIILLALAVLMLGLHENAPLELAWGGAVALAFGGLALSVAILQSRMLLVLSTFALIAYIIYFTAEYFADSIGWPVALILLGFTIIGIGYFSIRLGR